MQITRIAAGVGTAVLVGIASITTAGASDAHPSPDSSCTAASAAAHRTFRYSSPVAHKHDLLQCQHWSSTSPHWYSGRARWSRSGSHKWRIIGTW